MALERGAWVRLEARLEGGRLVDCAFRAWGCPHTLGAAAIAAERLVGTRVGMPAPVNAHALAALLAAPAEKLGRLLVVEDAMQALLQGASGLQLPVPAH
jgi:NifU-like protein involved in Fe-S cluster formation